MVLMMEQRNVLKRLREMERIEHIATIYFCYFRLKVLYKQLSNTKSNIERLVDKVCGYNETEEIRKECIMLVEQIIESKKQIGEDFTRDECVLNKLKRNEQL